MNFLHNLLRRKKAKPPVNGAFALSLSTAASAPRFFSTFALCLRASGFRIVVLAEPTAVAKGGLGGERLAAVLEIPFTDVRAPPASKRGFSEAEAQTWKLAEVRRLAREHHPVIWADLAFGNWCLEDTPDSDDVVTLNMAALLAKMDAGPSLPAKA